MSMVISDIKEKLASTPYTLDLEKNYEQIYMSLSGLSRELTARYLFNIEVEPLLRRNKINEFVGYQVKYDLFEFYKEDFKKIYGPGLRALFAENMILNEMTGRTQNDLRIKIKNLSQKFLDLWFIKDDKDTPYSKSNLKENVTVIRKIPGKESEVNINQTIFRFTLDGRIIVNSWDFNRLLKYATQPLDELVYLIFNKTPPQITRERYKIPDTCPSVVRNILDKAIGAYINLFYEFAAVGSRSAIETLLRIIYQQRTNQEPFDHPHCPKCDFYLGKRPMGFAKLLEWSAKEGIITNDMKQLGYLLSRLGAGGSHTTKEITPNDADSALKMAIRLVESIKT